MIRLGTHVSQDDPIREAIACGAEVAQLHLGNPQNWTKPEINYPGGADALKAEAQTNDIDLYVHAPFVINVASTNNRIRIPSRRLLQQTIDAAAAIGAKGVVVHGGHVTAKDDIASGFANWRKCIDGLSPVVPVLIENTAGGANAMARQLDRIEALWLAISSSTNIEKIGFCLDTCHAHGAGLALDQVVGQITKITGRIDLVHCNDSRDPLGTGADRHANLGQGYIDPNELVEVVREADTAVVIETPGGVKEHLMDLAWLRNRLNQ